MRFILKGRGLFHIHPDHGPVFAIQVEAGDLINVPLGTKHWFDLCADRTIRAIRLFQTRPAGRPRISTAARIHGTRRSVGVRPTSPRDEAVRGADMISSGIRAVLLDIEGTTSSVQFVYEVLFPLAAVS